MENVFEAIEGDLIAEVGLALIITFLVMVVIFGGYVIQQEVMYGGIECYNQTGGFCR